MAFDNRYSPNNFGFNIFDKQTGLLRRSSYTKNFISVQCRIIPLAKVEIFSPSYIPDFCFSPP